MPKIIDPVRENYLDNIRSLTIILVVIYHVVYIFNSAGVVSNIPVRGISAFDSICYFLYPWFMCLMFLTAGISARYSMQTRGGKQFAKERVQKLIVPFFGVIFLIGWINGWVSSQYIDMFGGKDVPGIVRYLVYCFNIGPLWFLLELFLISMILLLVRIVDKHDKIWYLAGNVNLMLIILLALPVWGSSFVLNTPVMVVFRHGIYGFVFFLGYYVFSHKDVMGKLKVAGIPLMVAAVLLGCVNVWYFFGKNYTSDSCLQHPLTNFYLWIMILAILGCSQRWLNFSNKLTTYFKKRSFAIYVCHYPILILMAFLIIRYLHFPMLAVYFILLAFTCVFTILFYEITSRIPVIRYLLFGMK